MRFVRERKIIQEAINRLKKQGFLFKKEYHSNVDGRQCKCIVGLFIDKKIPEKFNEFYLQTIFEIGHLALPDVIIENKKLFSYLQYVNDCSLSTYQTLLDLLDTMMVRDEILQKIMETPQEDLYNLAQTAFDGDYDYTV